MKKFMFCNYGGVPASQINEEAFGRWVAWFDSIKEHIVEGGSPFADHALSVTSRGVEPVAEEMWPARGYTIIKAENIDAAAAIAATCPLLTDDPERGTVRVYEMMQEE